jgi:hypothetical protein
VELKHPFEEFRDCLFGFPGGDRIVANVHAVNDAGVRVGEWLRQPRSHGTAPLT